ncbi:MAG: hypothetical protein NTY64_10430 [Deltaproteobacteria bacterium]|nr:hypothetical protein [Deltaproteobacteria bacterium]
MHVPFPSLLKSGRLLFDGFVKSPSAAYCQVRLTPQELCALHLELFTLPSTMRAFYEVITLSLSLTLTAVESS